MVVTIRNTCGVLNYLFHFVKDRKSEGLIATHVSAGRIKPLSVVYIEISNIENFSMWVRS